MSPEAAGAGYGAIEAAAGQVDRQAMFGLAVAQRIQAAGDQVLASRAENEISADIDTALQSYRQRTDYEAFTGDVQATGEELKKKYQAAYSGNPRVWNALEPYLDGRIRQFRNTIETKRIDLLTQDGRFQLDKAKDDTAQKISQAATPEENEAARNEFQLKTLAAEKTGIITKEQGYELRERLDLDAEKAEVIGGLRSTDPRSIVHTLDKIDRHEFKTLEARDPDWLTSARMTAENWLTTVSDKQQKMQDELSVNAAIGNLQETWTLPDGSVDYPAARKQLGSREFQKQFGLVDENGNPQRTRIQQAENYLKAFEGQTKDAEKQVHDKFEKDIGLMYLKGNYAGVLKTLGSPDNVLTGDETRTWTDAVREKQKAGAADPAQAALAIIRANDMIAKGEDPNAIRSFIVRNPALDKTDKEQYINKLESKLGGEIEEGRRLGYADIKDIIVPPARAFSLDAMIQTPQQTVAIKKAQMALDGWIDAQVKAGKPLKASEIRIQAHAFAVEYQPTFKESQEYLQKQAEDLAKQLGKKK
jgi:hypothetical protein